MTTHPFQFSVAARSTATAHEWRETARKAEDLGYHALSVPDHLDDEFAPLVALTAAAEATTTLRVTSLVLANDLRHPVVLAKEAATLDLLSGGRLELGIGAGWMTSDYDRTGLRMDAPGIRIDRLAEAITVLRGCFSGEPFSFRGEHYDVREVVGRPRCTRPHGPPLLVAGGGRRVLTLAGRTADIVGVNPNLSAGIVDERVGASATPAATDRKIDWVREAAGERFDQLTLQTRVHVAAITDDARGAAAALAPGLGLSVDDALASPHALVGSVDACVEHLHRWRERWGISYVGVSVDAMDALAPVVTRLR